MPSRPARRPPWTALALALAVTLTACGGNQQSSPSQSSGQSSGPGGQATAGEPKRDGTLYIALPQEPGNLDPQATTSLNTQRVREQLFDSLVAVDFDNKTVLPSLADSWTVSPDGLTYSFRLRQDVKFHSGKAMTAEDVRYTFER